MSANGMVRPCSRPASEGSRAWATEDKEGFTQARPHHALVRCTNWSAAMLYDAWAMLNRACQPWRQPLRAYRQSLAPAVAKSCSWFARFLVKGCFRSCTCLFALPVAMSRRSNATGAWKLRGQTRRLIWASNPTDRDEPKGSRGLLRSWDGNVTSTPAFEDGVVAREFGNNRPAGR